MAHVLFEVPPREFVKHVNVVLNVGVEPPLSLNFLAFRLEMALLLAEHSFELQKFMILALYERMETVVDVKLLLGHEADRGLFHWNLSLHFVLRVHLELVFFHNVVHNADVV